MDAIGITSRHLDGLLTYEEGLLAQSRALEEITSARALNGVILGLEHRAVVTLGKRGRIADDLTVSKEELERRGVDLRFSERGGQATLHAPGQLVIYPCVRLNTLGVGVRDYVKGLERATQNFLAELGVEAGPAPEEPGLYTSRGKIAFFGIRVSRGLASHGVSINVSNDLSLFGWIRSCGKEQERFDRLQSHGVSAVPRELFSRWTLSFSQTFS